MFFKKNTCKNGQTQTNLHRHRHTHEHRLRNALDLNVKADHANWNLQHVLLEIQ